MVSRQSVIVGLSGGVDSAAAALLLQRQGYDVRAVFMKNWSEDDFGGPCPWAEDQASALAVATKLNIPIETWNFEVEYRQRVFEAMIAEYERGRTPNPDILCNREIKFDLFLKRALKEADVVATGHYARTKDGRLFKAIDHEKDQSYFLAGVPRGSLDRVVFPLGELHKTAVRTLAREAGLPNWDRPDSVGICFIGEKKMKEFLSRYIKTQPGPIMLPDGTIVGEHDGLVYYTIGQRHGFGPALDQKKVAAALGAGRPLFVVEKQPASGALVVAPATATSATMTKELYLRDLTWIRYACSFPAVLNAKLRYRSADVAVTLMPDGDRFRVVCHEPQRAVTPGQYAVLYRDDECLGCGVIDSIAVSA